MSNYAVPKPSPESGNPDSLDSDTIKRARKRAQAKVKSERAHLAARNPLPKKQKLDLPGATNSRRPIKSRTHKQSPPEIFREHRQSYPPRFETRYEYGRLPECMKCGARHSLAVNCDRRSRYHYETAWDRYNRIGIGY